MIFITISPNFWLLLLASCLGLWGCGWTVSVVRKRRKERGLIAPIHTTGGLAAQKLTTALTNTAKVGLGVVLGMLLGMGIRDRQLTDNRITYTDVSILTRYAAHDFLVWPERMRQQHVQLCKESTVDWHEGEVLADWTFEQRQDCKRVISYHEKSGGKLDARVQMR